MARRWRASFADGYRVSTAKQGKSRLGLEAQRAAVAAYHLSKNVVTTETSRNADLLPDASGHLGIYRSITPRLFLNPIALPVTSSVA